MEQQLEARINSLPSNVYLKWDRFLSDRELSFVGETDVDPMYIAFESEERQAEYEKVVNAAATEFLALVDSGDVEGFTDEELSDDEAETPAESVDPDVLPDPADV